MAEIPGCLVTDSERPLDLIGADPLLRLAHEVGCDDPLPKGKFGIVEDGSRHDRELVAA